MSRPEVRIDAETVTALLARHVDPALVCVRVARSAVGNGQETWLIDAEAPGGGERRFVLRRSAERGVLDDTDREHEFRTLQAVHGAGLPTPRVHWLETAPSALGRAFFVMDRLPGRPPAPSNPQDSAAVARDLGRRLAELHAADLPVPGAIDVRSATAQRDRAVAGTLSGHAARAGAHPRRPARLAGGQPAAGRRAGAAAVGRRGPAQRPRRRHHHLRDARLGTEPRRPPDGGSGRRGVGLPRVAIRRTRSSPDTRTGPGPESTGRWCGYFAVLGCVSRTVMQLAGVAAFVDGGTTALNYAGLGLTLAVTNLRRAAGYAGWPVPEAAGPRAVTAAEPDELRLRPDPAETLAGICRFLVEDVLPATESAHARRGLKTAVGLLRATSRRITDDPPLAAELDARTELMFDRLERAGVSPAGGPRSAAALEASAELLESRSEQPAQLAAVRTDLRRTLLEQLLVRAEPLAALRALYGRDVDAGPPLSD